MELIDRINRADGSLDSVISIAEAIKLLVPGYYIDAGPLRKSLCDGVPAFSVAFRYELHRVFRNEDDHLLDRAEREWRTDQDAGLEDGGMELGSYGS